MTTTRRIYIYVVAFAGLGALALGLANLVRALIEAWVRTLSATSPGYLTDQVALWGGAALVGLPVWALHWGWARRLVRDPVERQSMLRRLYVYGVLAGSVFAMLVALNEILRGVEQALLGAPAGLGRQTIPPLPIVGIGAAVWLYHWRVAAADRAAVGETAGSASLRRWYLYGTAFVGWLVLLTGARTSLEHTYLLLVGGGQGLTAAAPGIRDTLEGLALWGAHWAWLPHRLPPADRSADQRATLRSVYLFFGLAVVVFGTLAGASQALYYGLARLLGVAEPGGVGGSLVQAAAGPLSVTVAYGLGWVYQRHAITWQSAQAEGAGQLGVRRLYLYLTSLLALAVLAAGLGGMLWILGDLAWPAPDDLAAAWWRDRLSLFATMTLVGLPTWLRHWQPRQAADSGSLVRRIYVYVVLTASMLTVLGSGATAVYRALSLALGAVSPRAAAVDLSHALAVLLVAALLSVYHWRTVQRDTRLAAQQAPPATGADVVVELLAPSQAILDTALAGLRAQGVEVHRRAA